jgi:lipopolysaccharide export system protein LptA
MRVTIERLRLGIVVAAALLIAVVLGFFFYGRYRFRHFERDLPGRLGANIQQTANGFSYTQSSQGHALFTLKASKELQLKSGHVLLHNVDITLYGPPGSQRTDHIFGSDFDYDQSHGTAVSRGEVDLDLQGANRTAGSGGQTENAGGNKIRVRTQALTFVQSTGEASTSAPVQFQLPRAAGSSQGADYNSKTGVVVLESQVRITTSSNGRPAVIEAAKATLERSSLQGYLVQPTMQYETESGSADAATVFFRKDGTTERVEAHGDVRMRTDTGTTVHSAAARILLDARSQPTETDLSGGVQFASEQPQERMEGSAENGKLLFASVASPRGGTTTSLRHAEFRQNARFADAMTGVGNDRQGRSERTMQAEAIDVVFAPPVPGHQPQAQTAIAEGNPVVTLLQSPSKGSAQTTRIRGDRLVATLGEDNVLRALDGTGHTEVDQSATDGSRDRSRGDALHATFVEQAAPARKTAASHSAGGRERRGDRGKKAGAGPRMETVLATAVQDGNVMLEETAASRPSMRGGAGAGSDSRTATEKQASATTLTGWAQHAEYTAADQVLHLSGHPRITDGAALQMAADTIEYHRDTQNAGAQGDVKATYAQAAASAAENGTAAKGATPTMGGNGPVHIIAQRAAMNHATNQSTFYGTVSAPARMWQDADSLLAPVILIDRNKNLLQAWGEGGPHATGEPQVDANFTTAMGARHEQTVVRVRSATMLYSDRERRGDFRGSVTAQDGNDAVRCDDALIFLKPEETATEKAAGGERSAAGVTKETAAGSGNAQLERMVATGHVVFTQPERRGNGEKLVYTAADGRYVLTGTASNPPTLWDQTHGTTTGERIAFNSENDSVEVTGGKGAAVTRTRTPK